MRHATRRRVLAVGAVASAALWSLPMTAAEATSPPPMPTASAGGTGLAREAVSEADRKVVSMERGKGSPDEISAARRLRSNLVQGWRREADAWLAAEPGNPAARAAVKAAGNAQARFYMPTGALVDP